MAAEQRKHVELSVKEVLRTIASDQIVVDAELPGKVAFDARGESDAGNFELNLWWQDHASAADYGVEGSELRGEVFFRVIHDIASENFNL